MQCQHLILSFPLPEILMNRTKRLEPEQLCENILAFDKELCNLNFLSELNNLLPTPEQVSRALLKRHPILLTRTYCL